MERIVTAAQARAKDAEAIQARGIPSLSLMRIAAEGVANAVKQRFTGDETVTAICGTGNNGGDGIAAALLLHREGIDARIVLCGDASRCTKDASYYLCTAREKGVSVSSVWEPTEHEILIDALFGVGLNRPVEGEYI